MKNFSIKYVYKINIVVGLAMLLFVGCEPDDTDAFPSTLPSTAEVFIDGFSSGLDFSAFGDSKVTAFQTDDEITYEKSDLSMRFDVPNEGDPESGYAGGVFFDKGGRDLSGYNVLSFYGRSSVAATIQELGFGLYETEVFKTSINNVSFSTAWTKYYILLPDASRLTQEQGMFYFVDTPDDGDGYSFWIDEVKFESLDTIGQITPIFQNGNNENLQAFVGQVLSPGGLGLSFITPAGFPQNVNPAPGYFSLSSSTGNATIRVNETTGAEEIVLVGEGEAVISAELGGVDAVGSLTLGISEFVAAPAPMQDPADVISIFSDAYTNVPVDFYNGFYAPFQTTESADFEVNGDNVLNYINYNFVGIEFNQNVPTIDGSAMDFLHVDIFIPEAFDPGSTLRINLRDYGADGAFAGDDDSIISTVLSTSTTPALVTGEWISVDFDISSLANRNTLGQIVFDAETIESPRPSGFFVDNIYFYNDGSGGGGDTPTQAAPTPPARDAADVISLFSNAYTDITVDTFYAAFSAGAGQTDEQVAGDDVKKYTDLDFAGIETLTQSVDLSAMTNFHMDVWTATSFDFIAGVVDFGGDGFDGGNDTRGDTPRTTLTAGQWTSIDVTIADLQAAGLTATPTDFSQLILDVADVTGTIWIDNIYFYNDGSGGGGDTPTQAAPTPPARDAADVISLFSNAYTDITVDTFYAAFSAGAGQTDEQVAGDDVKKYTDLDFAGIETLTQSVDLSAMTNFHMDVWTATSFDFIAGVVDFGGDGFDGGNDTRGDTPRTTLTAGQWTSIDVTIADLQAAGLTATPTDFSQLILDVADVTGTIWIDNIYFYK